MRFLRKVLVHAGLSPVLYHHTSVRNAISILKEDAFKMSATPGSGEQELSRGKFYFLSTSRLPYGSYSYHNVTFVLDGVKMGQRYAGIALRYWRGVQRTTQERHEADESEDRIISDKPDIPNASKYIKEVHYSKQGMNSESENKLRLEAKKLGLPIYAYKDNRDLKTLNKKRAVKPGMLSPTTMPSGFSDDGRWLSSWVAMYYAKDIDKLDDEQRRFVDPRYTSVAVQELSGKLGRIKRQRNPQRDRLFALWRKEGVRTPEQWVKFLQDKFAGQFDDETKLWQEAELGLYAGEDAAKAGRALEQIVEDTKKWGKPAGVSDATWKKNKDAALKKYFDNWYIGYHGSLLDDAQMRQFMSLPAKEQQAVQEGHATKKKDLWDKVV
jgi:hypothetical protein